MVMRRKVTLGWGMLERRKHSKYVKSVIPIKISLLQTYCHHHSQPLLTTSLQHPTTRYYWQASSGMFCWLWSSSFGVAEQPLSLQQSIQWMCWGLILFADIQLWWRKSRAQNGFLGRDESVRLSYVLSILHCLFFPLSNQNQSREIHLRLKSYGDPCEWSFAVETFIKSWLVIRAILPRKKSEKNFSWVWRGDLGSPCKWPLEKLLLNAAIYLSTRFFPTLRAQIGGEYCNICRGAERPSAKLEDTIPMDSFN